MSKCKMNMMGNDDDDDDDDDDDNRGNNRGKQTWSKCVTGRKTSGARSSSTREME